MRYNSRVSCVLLKMPSSISSRSVVSVKTRHFTFSIFQTAHGMGMTRRQLAYHQKFFTCDEVPFQMTVSEDMCRDCPARGEPQFQLHAVFAVTYCSCTTTTSPGWSEQKTFSPLLKES